MGCTWKNNEMNAWSSTTPFKNTVVFPFWNFPQSHPNKLHTVLRRPTNLFRPLLLDVCVCVCVCTCVRACLRACVWHTLYDHLIWGISLYSAECGNGYMITTFWLWTTACPHVSPWSVTDSQSTAHVRQAHKPLSMFCSTASIDTALFPRSHTYWWEALWIHKGPAADNQIYQYHQAIAQRKVLERRTEKATWN